jgi:hypothetical protein
VAHRLQPLLRLASLRVRHQAAANDENLVHSS